MPAVIDKVAIYVLTEVRHTGCGRFIQGLYIQWALYIFFHLKGGSSVAIGGRDGLFSLTPLTDSPATAAKDDEDGGGGGTGQQISHLFHYDTGMVTMFLCILPFYQRQLRFEGKPLKFEAFN